MRCLDSKGIGNRWYALRSAGDLLGESPRSASSFDGSAFVTKPGLSYALSSRLNDLLALGGLLVVLSDQLSGKLAARLR